MLVFFIIKIVFLCVFELLPIFSTHRKTSFLSHLKKYTHVKKPVKTGFFTIMKMY